MFEKEDADIFKRNIYYLTCRLGFDEGGKQCVLGFFFAQILCVFNVD